MPALADVSTGGMGCCSMCGRRCLNQSVPRLGSSTSDGELSFDEVAPSICYRPSAACRAASKPPDSRAFSVARGAQIAVVHRHRDSASGAVHRQWLDAPSNRRTETASRRDLAPAQPVPAMMQRADLLRSLVTNRGGVVPNSSTKRRMKLRGLITIPSVSTGTLSGYPRLLRTPAGQRGQAGAPTCLRATAKPNCDCHPGRYPYTTSAGTTRSAMTRPRSRSSSTMQSAMSIPAVTPAASRRWSRSVSPALGRVSGRATPCPPFKALQQASPAALAATAPAPRDRCHAPGGSGRC